MKTRRKCITVLAVFAVGSIFYGSLPANAGGMELDGVEIVFRRNHDAGPHMPPPPHAPRGHMPPPHGPGGHMPTRRGFEPRPGGHMPPHGHEPRGHMPPPHRY